MGQYWQIINIDKRQTLGFWGKLGEFLFDDSATELLPFLKIMDDRVPELDYTLYGFLPPTPTGTWIGDRIMCVGDYLAAGDNPDGVFTEEELAAMVDNRLYDLAKKSFNKPSKSFNYRDNNSSGTVQALCNLSTHEYVRDDLLEAEFADFDDSRSLSTPDLTNVILSRICWSSDPSASMIYDGNIKHH